MSEDRIQIAMGAARKEERDRCVALCRTRVELWRTTAERATVPIAREEARARANEAAYLADLLASDVQAAEAADA